MTPLPRLGHLRQRQVTTLDAPLICSQLPHMHLVEGGSLLRGAQRYWGSLDRRGRMLHVVRVGNYLPRRCIPQDLRSAVGGLGLPGRILLVLQRRTIIILYAVIIASTSLHSYFYFMPRS